MVGQEFLCSLPEAIFNVSIHGATCIAIDEDGVFGGLRHVEHVLRLAPLVKLRSHVGSGLLEVQAEVVTVADAQFAVRNLPVGRHRLSVTWRHGQRSVGRGRISKIYLLDADGFVT